MDKFHYKYRIPSIRLQRWDYRWSGVYFITICTAGRELYFGEIENKKMVLSPMGVFADILWHEIPNHTKNAELGAFVVMPNHIHGILILNGSDDKNVETGHALSLQSQQQTQSTKQLNSIGQQRFQNIGKNSVSSIIGSYKSAVTKHAHGVGFDFQWQSRFYDHIIRNDAEYQRITDYIVMNPQNWEQDKYLKSKEL